MTRTRFCAECGVDNKPLYESFCQICYWKLHTLATIKKSRIELPYCLTCGSVKFTSGWSSPNTQEEIAEAIAFNNLNLVNTNYDAITEIQEISKFSWIHPHPDFKIRYRVESDNISEFNPQTEKIDLHVKIRGGICKTCIKKKTGSGDVTVQFRAKNRKITPEEKDLATTIAFSHSSELSYESPEAYINNIIEKYGGLDFLFGNNSIAEIFIESVKSKWIGHYEKSFKLITEDKENKRVYAITHLFRLPEVKSGDLINWDDGLYLVLRIVKNGIQARSLRKGNTVFIRNWRELQPLDPPPIIVKKILISEEAISESYLFMDLETYVTEEVGRSEFPSRLEVGSEIKLLSWNNRYYLPQDIQISETR